MITGFIWFFSSAMVPQDYSSMGPWTKIGLCTYSNTAMYLGAMLISMYEGAGTGIQVSQPKLEYI